MITAVIVGGVSFMGGEGGVVARRARRAPARDGERLRRVSFGIDPNYANIITGAILIIAVSADQILHRQRERYQKAMAVRERAQFTEERRLQEAGEAPVTDTPVVTVQSD